MSKHNHAEAFCLMQYFGRGPSGSIELRIWNSRDGVTPFMTYSKEYGIELQHVHPFRDQYIPDYKPKKGELIWRDYTEEEARDDMEKRLAFWQKQLVKLEAMSEEDIIKQYGYDQKSQLRKMINDKERMELAIMETLERHEPRLVLVEEDWK